MYKSTSGCAMRAAGIGGSAEQMANTGVRYLHDVRIFRMEGVYAIRRSDCIRVICIWDAFLAF
jgi:hypothetical protein